MDAEADDGGGRLAGCEFTEGHPVLSPLLLMPNEVWTGVAWGLNVRDIGHIAACCKLLAPAATDPDLWLHLFMSTCWPPSNALLALTEGGTPDPGAVNWRCRLQTRAAAPPTLVVDVGYGYTKWSIVNSITGRPEGDVAPNIVQLCSSPTHPPECDRRMQLLYVHRQADLALRTAAQDPGHPLHSTAMAPASVAPGAGGVALLQDLQAETEFDGALVRVKAYDESSECWKVEILEHQCQRSGSASDLPSAADGTTTSRRSRKDGIMLVRSASLRPLRRAADLPLLVGEPFSNTAYRTHDGRSVAESQFAHAVREELQNRPGPVRIVSQAQMSLWAHGVDDGIVVNIGQQQTVAVVVVNGEAVIGLADAIGSARLTIALLNLMEDRHGIDQRLMTWCRDMKERYCYVAPPASFATGGRSLSERLEAGDDFGIHRIEVQTPEGRLIEMSDERVLVPELFFLSNRLPGLIVACAERAVDRESCGEEIVRTLLQQIVIAGGAADFPGMRPRVEFEVRELLREKASPRLRTALLSSEHAYVLNPPVGKHGPLITPRFVPLFGGCVRAASSLDLDEPLQPLAAAIDDASPTSQNAGTTHRMRMSLLRSIRAGPAAFRTGGGGGEDDNVWEMFVGDVWGDELNEESEDEESEEERNDSDVASVKSSMVGTDADMVDAGVAVSQFSQGSTDVLEQFQQQQPEWQLQQQQQQQLQQQQQQQQPQQQQAHRRRWRHWQRQRLASGGNGNRAGAGQAGGKGNGKSRGKGMYPDRGKSRGKGKSQKQWQPVARQM